MPRQQTRSEKSAVSLRDPNIASQKNRQPTTDNRQPTTNNRQPTTDNRLPATDYRNQACPLPFRALEGYHSFTFAQVVL
ncbi:MAG: hypothetical protein SF339_06710 [Blastocatellia bacterium]|nr:hypothetical protein [Blastocatellia bacterium]